MKIVVVSGSMRNGSQTLKVCQYLSAYLQSLGAEVEIVDLNERRLPFFDDGDGSNWLEIWQPIEATLASADGFILASPEWDGMFSAGIHNLYNFVASASTKQVMAHKPVLFVGVSGGLGGAYPIAQMKQIGQKNTHYVILPDHLRFAQVEQALKDGEIVVDGLKARVDYTLRLLLEYTKALKTIRENPLLDTTAFASGV